MLLLAIESSCDETAAAVVRDGRHALSNVIASQVDVHARYGGVVPEIASRKHLEAISVVVEEALERASVTLAEIEAAAKAAGLAYVHIPVRGGPTPEQVAANRAAVEAMRPSPTSTTRRPTSSSSTPATSG